MASNDLSIKVQDHGSVDDQKKMRVKCNHCGKIVSGFSRLKYHLGGVRGDVVPCLEVPLNVKDAFHNELIEKKRRNLSREVGELRCPNLPLGRNLLPPTNSTEPCESGLTQTSGLRGQKRSKIGAPSEDHGVVSATFTKTPLGSESIVTAQSSSPIEFQKQVGRFFYETGTDFIAATCPSFQRMINANFGSKETAYPIPSSEDLKGWILQESMAEMQQYVSEIRSSWASTGCSILLDGWEDLTGRKLLNVLVACPKGTVYIRSEDISKFDQEVDGMLVFFDVVLKDVGIQNIVQIVTYSTSAWMETVGKQLTEKYKTLFWSVSAPHCLELMLEEIATMKVVKDTMDKAKIITRFVHSYASVLKLLRDQTFVHGLVRSSKFKLTVPFLTLENMVFEQENLQKTFLSSAWKNLKLASSMEGKRVAELVADCSFWTGAEMVLKATIPLVRVIDLITRNNEPQLGYIYETMDQAKETIKEEFKNKKSKYMPFWKAIDKIWNRYLHSPLHAAGYFFNPKLFYSSDFYSDSEVASGLLCCTVRLAEGPGFHDVVSTQIEEYRTAKGAFGIGSADLQSSAESWWLNYGSGRPQLQRLAIRILSQTCSGATKFNLKRDLVEKFLTKGENTKQPWLAALVFVHYNLQLQNFNLGIAAEFSSYDIDPMDDLVVDNANAILSERDKESGELTWKDLAVGYTTKAREEGNPGNSNLHLKQKP
ncbi:hypothetical protein ACH5RR_031883 [Cinchona calisaya]|uniref:DUF659 domain-containing protein n=1 Tax=Cinchona calisaya TaxID=153742 RepID=A0ABD2YIF9_9GENT